MRIVTHRPYDLYIRFGEANSGTYLDATATGSDSDGYSFNFEGPGGFLGEDYTDGAYVECSQYGSSLVFDNNQGFYVYDGDAYIYSDPNWIWANATGVGFYTTNPVAQPSAPTLVATTTPTLTGYGFTLAQAEALIAIANATASALSATNGGNGLMA